MVLPHNSSLNLDPQLFGQPCKEGPLYFEVALLTTTIFLSLWISHIRIWPERFTKHPFKVLGGSLYDLLLLLVIIVLVGLPIALVTPTYYCVTNRTLVSEMILDAFPLREQVDARALRDKSLGRAGEGLLVTPTKRVKGGLVSKDGTIVVVSDEPAAAIMLVPTYLSGSVKWRCVGFPSRVMPANCSEK